MSLIEDYSNTLNSEKIWDNTILKDFVNGSRESFKELGIPNKKLEDWKYTNPEKALLKNINNSTNAENIDYKNFVINKENFVAIKNGVYDEENSKVSDDISISYYKPNSKDLTKKELELLRSKHVDAFDALNGASMQEVLFVTIDSNKNIETPLSIAHIATNKDSNLSPRIIITAKAFSKSTIAEIFCSTTEEKYQRSAVTNILVEESSNLTHVKVQNENKESFHYGKVEASILKSATFTSLTFNTGANVARNNIHVFLDETDSYANVHGLFPLRENQHADNFSQIHHNVSHTYSTQLFKGILDDNSHGIFTGKIVVHRDAQEIDSSQLSKNLLLSKKAHINTRPQLEVYADDVKCAHGATVGQISEDEIFYLQSRGISKERAQKILSHAFAAEAIEKIDNKETINYLNSLLFDNFEKFSLGDIFEL